jgi:hypothetical protein
MERIADQFTASVDLVRDDGSRAAADLHIERRKDDGRTLFAITLERDGKTFDGTSEEGFFHALRRLRLELEKDNILLCCFGASEDVYPSGTQVSSGGTKAYRRRLGAPALLKDAVDIFASDDSVKPATVEQQEKFRERWLASF